MECDIVMCLVTGETFFSPCTLLLNKATTILPSSLLSLVSNAVILIRSDMFKAFIYTGGEYFCKIYSLVLQDEEIFMVILWCKAREDFPHKKKNH